MPEHISVVSGHVRGRRPYRVRPPAVFPHRVRLDGVKVSGMVCSTTVCDSWNGVTVTKNVAPSQGRLRYLLYVTTLKRLVRGGREAEGQRRRISGPPGQRDRRRAGGVGGGCERRCHGGVSGEAAALKRPQICPTGLSATAKASDPPAAFY